MNLLSTGKSALRVPPLPSPPKRSHFISWSLPDQTGPCYRFSDSKARSLHVQNASYFMLGLFWVCEMGMAKMRTSPPIFLLPRGLGSGCMAGLSGLLVGEPVKKYAKPTGARPWGFSTSEHHLNQFPPTLFSLGSVLDQVFRTHQWWKEGRGRAEPAPFCQLLLGVFVLIWRFFTQAQCSKMQAFRRQAQHPHLIGSSFYLIMTERPHLTTT